MGLPLAKLRQVPPPVRAALKVRHMTTCDQLLAAAARFEDRAALARAARIDPDRLTGLVRQAELERVKGVGWAFSLMLEALAGCGKPTQDGSVPKMGLISPASSLETLELVGPRQAQPSTAGATRTLFPQPARDRRCRHLGAPAARPAAPVKFQAETPPNHRKR